MSDPVILEDDEVDIRPPRPAPAPPVEEAAPVGAKTPDQIDAELGLPPAERGLAPMPQGDAGFWEIAGASWRAETIRTDAWNDTIRRRDALTEAMWARLPQDARDRIWEEKRKAYFAGGMAHTADLVADEAGRLAAASPEAAADWAGYPTSREAFARQIDAGRTADLDEAERITGLPGGGVAEFLGAAGRAITDETSLMLLPFGVSGSAWRTILAEAALGAAGEAAVLPKEYRVAGELGLPDPDPVSRIAMGAAMGGGFAVALHGLGRGISAFRARAEARRASLAETLPDGVDRIDHEAQVEAADAELRGDQTVQERLGPGAAEAPPAGTLGAIVGQSSTALPPVGPDAPANWEKIRNGIFAGESGADWNALFAYANRKGGRFGHIRPTEMTVDQWLAFQDPSGPYGQWVASVRPDREKGVATPMGAYQIVGTTLRAAKKALGLKGDEVMTPEMQDYIAQWIYRQQGTSAWVGYKGPRDSYTPGHVDGPAPPVGPTSRGYTGDNQVSVGDWGRIDVDWEVVDASTLLRAWGDYQPRDRSRKASDVWIAQTAARLDPAMLMRSPTADRGAPLVGPDNMIESGNGRIAAIERVYAMHPDRAQAYRSRIEAEGFVIPEGMERPVLIARRRTELDDGARKQMVVAAQDSTVAQMTPVETAIAHRAGLTPQVLDRYDAALDLSDPANADFAKAALDALPRSMQSAMFDDQVLNSFGRRTLREIIFARAWEDWDIVDLFTEGEAGDFGTLLRALGDAAPEWAAMKADIERGLVAPEMDITGFVTDAVRVIAAARRIARRENSTLAQAMAEVLATPDLMEGAIAPLTAALIRKLWKNGRVARADDVADFLKRYADDARKVGRGGGLFDAPGPREVLRAIDPDTFGDLPEDLGQARGFARPGQEAPPEAVADPGGEDFDQGAQSPGAEAADAEIAEELRSAAPFRHDPDNPLMADTRGKGVRYHGATAPIDRLVDGFVGSDRNFYGNGFYTSDAVSITDGYSKAKGAKDGAVYRVDEVGPVNPLDMEQPVPEWLISDYRAFMGDDGPFEDLVIAAVEDMAAEGRQLNLREFYDLMREISPEMNLPTYEVQEYFDVLSDIILKRGFNALDHTGGLLTKKTPHSVRIYLKPDAQLRLVAEDIENHRPPAYFGPVHRDLTDKPEEAIARLLAEKDGEVPDAVIRKDLGPIAIIYGSKTMGLRHIQAKHPEILPRLATVLREGELALKLADRVYIQLPGDPPPTAVVRLDWSGDRKAWLVTAFDDDQGHVARQLRRSNEPAENAPSGIPDATGLLQRNADAPSDQAPDAISAELAAARADLGAFADVEVDLPDGIKIRAGEALDDLDADSAADAVLQACGITPDGGRT